MALSAIGPPRGGLGDEPTRARCPDATGHVERDGVRVFWERYGAGEPPLYFLPTWPIAPSRIWRMQLSYFGRHFQAITSDPRGHGGSDRPSHPSAYREDETLADFLDVLDANGAERAVLVGASLGARYALRLAAEYPERVLGIVAIASFFPVSRRPLSLFWRLPQRLAFAKPPLRVGMSRFNAHVMRGDLEGFVAWCARRWTSQPHSTRGSEEAIRWGNDATPEVLFAWMHNAFDRSQRGNLELASRIRCPALVIHGTADRWCPYADGVALAKAGGARLVSVRGGDHAVAGRRPVAVNLAIRRFVEELAS